MKDFGHLFDEFVKRIKRESDFSLLAWVENRIKNAPDDNIREYLLGMIEETRVHYDD